MIKTLHKTSDFIAGKTRVRSKLTGSIGTVVDVLLESENQDRYDSIIIEWDNTFFKPAWLFVSWTGNLEIIHESKDEHADLAEQPETGAAV